MTNAEIPQHMVPVSAERFYEVVGPMDVSPVAGPHVTVWETRWPRVEVGRSWPGYMAEGHKQFALARELA